MVCGMKAPNKQNVKLLIIKSCGIRIRRHMMKLREQFKRKERKSSSTQWALNFWNFFAIGDITIRFKKGLQKLIGNRTICRF